MKSPYFYRLFHRHVGKYVAWPHGRGFVKLDEQFKNIVYLMTMLRTENSAWGGTDDLPVLEIHALNGKSGGLIRVISLSIYDAEISMARRITRRRRALRRVALVSAPAAPPLSHR